ncbi:MAG: hypothetical protein WAS33_00415 [Candidatus Promineifilaceae bacterium]
MFFDQAKGADHTGIGRKAAAAGLQIIADRQRHYIGILMCLPMAQEFLKPRQTSHGTVISYVGQPEDLLTAFDEAVEQPVRRMGFGVFDQQPAIEGVIAGARRNGNDARQQEIYHAALYEAQAKVILTSFFLVNGSSPAGIHHKKAALHLSMGDSYKPV